MSYILAILQMFFVGVVTLYEIKRKSSAVFLWATLFLMFGMPHFFSVFSDYEEYSVYVMEDASIFVIFFSLLYMLVRVYFSTWREFSLFNFDNVENNKITKYLVCVLVFVMFWRLYPFINYSGGMLNTSWGSGREFSASQSYVNLYQFLNVIFYSFSGIGAYFWLCKKRFFASVVFVVLFASVLITRNRIEIMPLFVSILFVYLINVKKIGVKDFLVGLSAVVVVVYVVYGIRVFRHAGNIEVFLSDFDLFNFIGTINSYIEEGNGELGLKNVFYFFLSNDNDFANFGELHSYLRMLLVYVPTQWSSGLKPPDFAQSMGTAIGMVAGGSTHPTLFGDCYANAGFLGVFLGVFWAIYANIADYLVDKFQNNIFKVLAYVLYGSMFAIQGRGSVYNSFFFVAWGIPFLFLCEKILTSNLRNQCENGVKQYGGKV